MHTLKSIKKSGFTLIEMLVAIVIIGVLALLVTTAYQGYQKRAQQSNISATVSSYQAALSGVTIENDTAIGTLPGTAGYACITSTTSPCCTTIVTSYIMCASNPEIFTSSYSTTEVYDNIKNYLPNNRKILPKITDANFPDCTDSTFGPDPCNNQQITYFNFIGAGTVSDSPKGMLSYFLPSSYDCQSSDVMNRVNENGDTAFRYTTNNYTTRVISGSTRYTECVVGIH